jgi:AcrR family transcriptional regulator
MTTAKTNRTDPGPRVARQARSQASHAQLLLAAERVLAAKDFVDATLADIAAAAGLTTGAVYARFANKADLLATLERQTCDELEAEWGGALTPSSSLTVTLRAVITATAAAYGARRGVLRALIVESRRDPALRRRLNTLNRRLLHAFTEALAVHRGEIVRRDVEAAAQFAMLLFKSALRETVLFAAVWPLRGELTVARLVDELVCATLAYLRSHAP